MVDALLSQFVGHLNVRLAVVSWQLALDDDADGDGGDDDGDLLLINRLLNGFLDQLSRVRFVLVALQQ